MVVVGGSSLSYKNRLSVGDGMFVSINCMTKKT